MIVRCFYLKSKNNIFGLIKNKIGKRKFQKLLDAVEPKAEEIVEGILDR
jgi:hypothetical protein